MKYCSGKILQLNNNLTNRYIFGIWGTYISKYIVKTINFNHYIHYYFTQKIMHINAETFSGNLYTNKIAKSKSLL